LQHADICYDREFYSVFGVGFVDDFRKFSVFEMENRSQFFSRGRAVFWEFQKSFAKKEGSNGTGESFCLAYFGTSEELYTCLSRAF
jgi:hypothetical protein